MPDLYLKMYLPLLPEDDRNETSPVAAYPCRFDGL